MAKSRIFDKLLNELTPEKIEEMRLRRITKTKALTVDYQLGWYVGEKIINDKLPTLDIDDLQTRHIISVSNEERLEVKRLNDVWFANYSDSGDDDENWVALRKYRAMLQEKYLPEVLECHLPPLNVGDMDEFKKGLRTSLWDSDVCYYDITNNDCIEVVDDVDGYFTTIKLKYKKSEL